MDNNPPEIKISPQKLTAHPIPKMNESPLKLRIFQGLCYRGVLLCLFELKRSLTVVLGETIRIMFDEINSLCDGYYWTFVLLNIAKFRHGNC